MTTEKRLKNLLPYGILLLLIFYLLPKLMVDTGSAMFLLLLMTPLLCFMISLFFGYKQGFDLLYLLMIALLFAPTLLIYYNSSAWVYIFFYTGIGLIGTLLGSFLNKNFKKDS